MMRHMISLVFRCIFARLPIYIPGISKKHLPVILNPRPFSCRRIPPGKQPVQIVLIRQRRFCIVHKPVNRFCQHLGCPIGYNRLFNCINLISLQRVVAYNHCFRGKLPQHFLCKCIIGTAISRADIKIEGILLQLAFDYLWINSTTQQRISNQCNIDTFLGIILHPLQCRISVLNRKQPGRRILHSAEGEQKQHQRKNMPLSAGFRRSHT